MLIDSLQFTSDTIDKDSNFADSFPKKSLEVLSSDWNQSIGSILLVQLSSIEGTVIHVARNKENSIISLHSKCCKVIFVLLYKIITLYIELTA